MNFWQQLAKPFFVLAPMDDVTDSAFRSTIAHYSKRDGATYVTYTEFTAADGLVHAPERGQEKLRAKLRYTEAERPIVAQIFSSKPEHMRTIAAQVRELGFDGVDINMGCPDRSIEKQGCGSALIKNPQLAQEIIYATKEGAGDIPVSVKTRIGYDRNQIEEWLPTLLETKPAVVTLHARTRNDMSKVPAKWEVVARAVEIRDEITHSGETLIVGNGDVQDVAHARVRAEESGADGVMIGRGMFGNPWVMTGYTATPREKIEALIVHTQAYEKEFEGIKSFAVMKKHFASYVTGFDGAKELRMHLMAYDTATQTLALLRQYLVEHSEL